MTEELLTNILAYILAITIVIALIMYAIYLMIYIIKTENMRQKHITTLNEHDKSVILDYKNTFWSLKKKAKRKNENM